MSTTKPMSSPPKLIIDKVPALITVYSIKTGQYSHVNHALKTILGYPPKAFLQGGIPFAASLIHPDDLDKVMVENERALKMANQGEDITSVNFEYRMRHKKGHYVWLHTDGSVFARDAKGKVESVLNVSVDITAHKNQENTTKTALKESESRYKTFLSQSTQGIWRFELEKPISTKLSPMRQINHYYKYAYLAECNDALARMYGYQKAEDIIGARMGDMLPKDDPNNIAYLKAFIESGYKLEGALSNEIDKEGNSKVMQNNLVGIIENDQIVRAWGSQSDVTTEKKLQERLELLELANRKLLVSLDRKIAIQEVTKLIVPHFADYCRVVLLDESGDISEIVVNHIEPKKIKLIKKLYDLYKHISPRSYGVPSILLKGEPEIISRVDTSFLKTQQVKPEIINLIKKIGLKSYMGVPLIARGKVFGAVTFSSIREERIFTKDDLQFANILVARIALMIDNFRLYENAQKSIDVRDNFISIASHELKTPLTSLKLYSEILQKQSKKVAQKNLRSTAVKIDAQVNKLTYLIGDLLDISKIQAGKMEYKFEHFDLSKFVSDIIETISPIQKTHNIQFKAVDQIKIYADKNRIEQVVVNFISNAVKYSPNANKVMVKIKKQTSQIVFSVKDYGIGIDKPYIEKIFDKFFQVKALNQEGFPGMGIGLYISKQIIQRHGGKIKVVSKKGQGSTFSFILPHAPEIEKK